MAYFRELVGVLKQGSANTHTALPASIVVDSSGNLTVHDGRTVGGTSLNTSDDPSNSSSLGAPAIVRGTVYAHLASGVTTGSNLSTAARQANAIALQNAINYAATNRKFFEVVPNTYEFHSPTGLVIPASVPGGYSLAVRGSIIGSQLIQYYNGGSGAPVLTIGDPTGANQIVPDVSGLSLSYGVAQTGLTNSQTLVVGAANYGRVGEIAISPGHSNAGYDGFAIKAATGGNFSVTYENFIIHNAQRHMMYFNATGSTGNQYNNFCMEGAATWGNWSSAALSGSFIYFDSDAEDMKFNRLNCEWASCASVIYAGGSRGLVFDALHFEGIQLSGAYSYFFDLINANVLVNGMEVVTPNILSANTSGGNPPTFVYDYPGGASAMRINGLTWRANYTPEINTKFYFLSLVGGAIGDQPSIFTIENAKTYDPTGTNQLNNLQLDTHVGNSANCVMWQFGRYSYGITGSRIENASLYVYGTYTLYGQFVKANILVPASITSFILTLAATMGATGTQAVETGNVVHVRRQSGSATGTLTIKDDAGTTLVTSTTAAADYYFIFNGTHYVTFTPVT